MSEPVQVFIRVKPEHVGNSHSSLDEDDDHFNDPSKHSVLVPIDGKSIRISPPDGSTTIMSRRSVPAVDDRIFSYDQILGENCTQEDVYELVSHQVRATVQGYNATIFALGCTGSGKTHTMTGTSAAPGIIPRAISEIFSIIETTAAHEKDVFFYVRLSFVELYNNNFRNLLDFASKDLVSEHSDHSPSLLHPRGVSASGTTIRRSDKIEVRESQSAGVFLAGHNLRIPVTTAQEAFRLIARGNKSRATGSTQCNDVSSRSHAILTLHVESRVGPSPSAPMSPVKTSLKSPSKGGPGMGAGKSPRVPGAELRLGKIHLVDLAGSERISMSGVEGDTLVETQNINLSLTALGDVLAALSKNASIASNQTPVNSSGMSSPGKHTMVPVPYRNSKLTHLLKDSLGGNSKTIMLTTVQSSPEYYHQTLVSLKYASRAKKVRNRSLVNRDIIGDSGIHAVSKEIERLKNRLDARSNEFNGLKNVQLRDAKENIELKRRLQEMSQATLSEKDELEAQLSHVIHSQAGELVTQKKKISHLQYALQEELSVSQNKIAEQEKEIIWLKRALDETSTAALQPIEQLERVQRVADAWQTQAKHSQSELETTTIQIEELRVTNRTYSSNMSSLAAEKKRLEIDLQQGQRQIGDYEAAMASSKKDRELATKQAEQLREQLQQSTQEIFQLKNQLAESSNRIAALERALDHAQTELKMSVDTSSRVESEHKRVVAALTQGNEQLKAGLQDTLEEIDRQMQAARDDASVQLEAAEAKCRQEQEHTRSALSEVEAMKRRIVEIHGDVEQVTLQREETITHLKESLATAEEANQEHQLQHQQMDKVIKGQIKELNSLRNMQEEEAIDFSNKCHEFENELARQQQHITQLKERHFQEQEEMKKNHEHQLHDLHENSTLEIVKFRDDISTSLSAQQKVLSEKHVAELARAKEDERVEIENQWMAKLMALEEALRFKEEELRVASLREKEEEVAQVKEEWGAVLSEQLDAREEQHALGMKKLTQELMGAKDSEVQRLRDTHARELAELAASHQLALTRMQEDLTALFEQSQADKLQEAETLHHQQMQELRAGQFTVLKETENSYKLDIENHQTTIALYEERHQQNTEEVLAGHVRELEKMEQQHQHELEEAFDTYQAELEKMNKNLVATKIEEKLTLSKKHEENITTLTKKQEAKHEKLLQAKLLEAEEAHERAMDQMRTDTQREVEGEWRNRLLNAEEENQGALEAALSMQREELLQQHRAEAEQALQQARLHFQSAQHSEELARQADHQQGVDLLTSSHAAAINDLEERHKEEVEQLRISIEESFSKKMEMHEIQLKEVHEIELRGRLKERDSRNELHLAAELSALRQGMEKTSAEQERSSNEMLTERLQALTEELTRKHQEALSSQATLLDRAHDRSLQLAVQEVRQMLENLHRNETHSLKEQQRLQTEEQQTMFDEVLANRVAEVRAACEEDKAQSLGRELASVQEQDRVAQAELQTRHLAALQAVEKAGADRFAARWEEMKNALEQEHRQVVASSLEEQRLDLSAEHLDALQEALSQAQALLQRTREEDQHSLEQQLAAQEQRLREEATLALETGNSSFQEAISTLQQTHDLQVEEHSENMKLQHAEQLEALRNELVAQQGSSLQEMEAQSTLQLKELRAVLGEEMAFSLEEQTRELQCQHESALSALQQRLESSHDTALHRVQHLLDEKEATLQEMTISLESLQATHRQDQDQLASDHARDKLEMTRSHEAKVELLRDDYNKFFEESKRNSELAAESVTRNLLHDQQIELLEAQNVKISAVKDALSAEYAQQVASLQADHALQLEKVVKNTEMESQSHYNKRIDDLKAQGQLERENAEANLRAQYKDEISLLRVEYNRFLEESKQNVTLASEMAMKNSLQAQRAELLETHREQSAQGLEALRESLGRAHADKLAALEKSQEQEVARVRAEHQSNWEEAKQLQEVSAGLKLEHALHLQKGELQEAHKQVLLKMVADLNQESDGQKLEAKQALEELQLGFKRTLEQSQEDAEKELEQRLEEALRENQTRLEEEHARQLLAAKEASAEEVALLRSEYTMLLEENKKNCDAAADMALESALETQRNELETAHMAALDVLRSTLVTQHATELSGVLEEHEQYLDQQTARAEEEYQTRLSDQLASLQEHMQGEIERAEEDTRREFALQLEQDLQQARLQTQEQAEKDIDERVMVETHKLSREHELALSAQYEEVRRTADERLLSTQTQLEEWRQKYESHKQFFDNEKALTDARNAEVRQALEKTHAHDLVQLRESQTLDREVIITKHQSELEELRARLKLEHDQILSEQMAELNSLRAHDQSELLRQKDSKISELSGALQEVEVHHGDLLAAALREQKAGLAQEQEAGLQAVRVRHAEEMEQLRASLGEEAVAAARLSQQEAADREASTLRALEELRSEHAEEREQEGREAARVLSQLRVQHKQTVDDLAKKHSAELMAIKQQFDQSVSKFHHDSDHIRETSLQSELHVSEAHQRDKAALELQYQTKLDGQLNTLRAKFNEQMTTAGQREVQLESELEAVQTQLRQERAKQSTVSVTSDSELQAQRDESEFEMKKLRESSRDEIVRVQNMHFDEITSLKIQTQREMSESQENIRVMLLESRKKDEIIDSMTQEQHQLQENSSAVKMQAQKELLEVQENLRMTLLEAERKDNALAALTQEQQRLTESMEDAQAELTRQLSRKEEEVISTFTAQHSEQLEHYSAQVAAAEEKSAALQTDLLALETRFIAELREKDEQHNKLTASLESCVDTLEAKIETLSSVDDGREAFTEQIEELTRELAAERNKTLKLSAQLDAIATDPQHSSLSEEGVEQEGIRTTSTSTSTSTESKSSDVEGNSAGAEQVVREELARVQAELAATRTEHAATVQHLHTQREELVTTVRVLQVQEQEHEQQRFMRMKEDPHSYRGGGGGGAALEEEEERGEGKEEEEARNVALLSDLRLVYDQEISQLKAQFQHKLSEQREEMQGSYLTLLQKQMANLMGLVHSQDDDSNQGDALPKLEEMQSQFASFVEQLPDSLRQQLLSENMTTGSQTSSSSVSSRTDTHTHRSNVTRRNSNCSGSGSLPSTNFNDRASTGSETDHLANQSRHVHRAEHSSDHLKKAGATATWSNLHIQNQDAKSRTRQLPHSQQQQQHLATASFATSHSSHALKENSNAYHNSHQDNDWSSVSSMVKPPISPNDQLIAAILDGDVQGVRTIVRSRGDSLLSEYWRDLALSVLPLHRAISGLHFHGSDQKLIHTIETLVQLGAAIDARDHAGNTVLHKALQVCTSTSVVAVVECIIKKGGSPSVRNNVGQCPIHIECSRVRTATSKVLTVLLRAGVDPNVLTKASRSRGHGHTQEHGQGQDSFTVGSEASASAITLNITPLHLILQRAMSLATAQHADDVSVSDHQHQRLRHSQSLGLPAAHTSTSTTTTTNYLDDSAASVTNATGSAYPSKMRVSGRRAWVQAAYILVKAGATWNSAMVVQPGHSQLYLFLHAFPPPPEDAQLYRSLLRGALAAPGMNPLREDEQGRSALFVLCEQMAKTPREKCPVAGDILSTVLQHVPEGGIGGADRSGRTVFDLEAAAGGGGGMDTHDISCLQASRQLLVEAGTRGGRPDTHAQTQGQGHGHGQEQRQAWGWGAAGQGEETHSSAHSGHNSFRPPDERQLRQQQMMMPADEYVINGVEKMNRNRY